MSWSTIGQAGRPLQSDGPCRSQKLIHVDLARGWWGRAFVVFVCELRSFLYRVLRGASGSMGAAPVAQSKNGPSLRR
jgi:hypothetical protein